LKEHSHRIHVHLNFTSVTVIIVGSKDEVLVHHFWTALLNAHMFCALGVEVIFISHLDRQLSIPQEFNGQWEGFFADDACILCASFRTHPFDQGADSSPYHYPLPVFLLIFCSQTISSLYVFHPVYPFFRCVCCVWLLLLR